MSKFSIIKEYWDFIKTRKKWWFVPIVIVLLLLGMFIVITETSSVAPLIYALF